jgi:two-component sensor histidine kinase
MESADPQRSSVQHREFASTLDSIGSARDFVAEVLADPTSVPPVDAALIADVQLVVSELVTNALTHGAGPAGLALSLTSSEVTCSVTSAVVHAELPAAPSVPAASARSGRGLAIVNAVADSVATLVDQSTWTVNCGFLRR